MDIKADEISKIIREQIGSFAVDVDVAEVGSIISVGDGIERVHGVDGVVAVVNLTTTPARAGASNNKKSS